ncbi:hypothetical protein GCM10022422_25230 [Flavobacterium ginsengisoli]|uniref:Uncharacterized protein n=1 Tax=Flavobacterium ginsengisoli TaxID=871694 RepID=A0ABP7FI63_9FLAO
MEFLVEISPFGQNDILNTKNNKPDRFLKPVGLTTIKKSQTPIIGIWDLKN